MKASKVSLAAAACFALLCGCAQTVNVPMAQAPTTSTALQGLNYFVKLNDRVGEQVALSDITRIISQQMMDNGAHRAKSEPGADLVFILSRPEASRHGIGFRYDGVDVRLQDSSGNVLLSGRYGADYLMADNQGDGGFSLPYDLHQVITSLGTEQHATAPAEGSQPNKSHFSALPSGRR